jgi:dTDP-4-dehydrorhamnose reductase
LAEQIKELIKTEHYGIYHITNHGECSWYEFAKKIFELMNLKVNCPACFFKPISNFCQKTILFGFRKQKVKGIGN